jgi:hypothetical protein
MSARNQNIVFVGKPAAHDLSREHALLASGIGISNIESLENEIEHLVEAVHSNLATQ